MPLTKIWLPLTALIAAWSADAAVLSSRSSDTPIARVTKMLDGIMAKIRLQGETEQRSYDEFSSWCEETLKGTTEDIAKGKDSIEELTNEIVKLNGQLGSLGAEVKQLNKDVSENEAAQKDSEGIRDKEFRAYESDKTESIQCIGALEQSIRVLSSDKKFLQNGARASGAYEQAQLMSVAADVRAVIQTQASSQLMSQQDLKRVREFVSNPAAGVSAVQTAQGQNPFGDFAPQSTQIQGILKGLHDGFTNSLAKAEGDEADAKKAYETLMETKKQELHGLRESLDKQELEFAEKKRKLAESKEQLDDSKVDLEAAESLFTETEATCSKKAKEFSEREKLREQELKGIEEAVHVLTSPEADKAFKGAASLVQLGSLKHRAVRVKTHQGASSVAVRQRAYAQLRALAAQYDSLETARIAAKVKSGSAFDKVISMIDRMIADLRKEEQEDVEHRDRCENSQNKNANEKEDLAHSEATTKEQIERLENEEKSLHTSLDTNEKEAQDIDEHMAERLHLRNEEHDEFVRALEMDTDAVKIIKMAQEALAKFYEKQGSPEELVQTAAKNTEIEMEPPKTSWGDEGGKYGGQKGMNQAALVALDVIREDLEKEIKTGRAEDDENQKKYLEDTAAAEKALETKKETIAEVKKQLAELGVKLEDKQASLSQTVEDSNEAAEMANALDADCNKIKTNFDKMRKERKAEIAGLQEAKDHLAKSGSDDDDNLDMDGQ